MDLQAKICPRCILVTLGCVLVFSGLLAGPSGMPGVSIGVEGD